MLSRSLILTCLSLLLVLPSKAVVSGPEKKELNFAVSLPAPPSRIYKIWQPFIRHLEAKTGYTINLLTPKGLDGLEHQLSIAQIDFIYINSYAFYTFKQNGLLEPIAQMRNKEGHITSRGRVLVRKDSGISRIEDLRGGSLSLISPHGAGSYLAPRAMLQDHGLQIDRDISVSFSGDLKKSVYDVLLNETTAAVMCGVNYEIISKKLDLQDIFVMQLTDEFPEGVIAARPGVNDQLKRQITEIIIDMSNNYAGRKALSRLRNTKIYDFIPYDPTIEARTQALLKKANL